jgi:hypothetical protein
MSPQSIDLCVNPADETIRLGPLVVRFLVTGENSSGTVAIFEVVVPAAQRLTAPAHSHERFEETVYGIEGILTWTVDGKLIDVGNFRTDEITPRQNQWGINPKCHLTIPWVRNSFVGMMIGGWHSLYDTQPER